MLMNLSAIEILDGRLACQTRPALGCALPRRKLLVVNLQVSNCCRLVAGPLRLLHRHVAGVRREQRVRLLAHLDLLVLRQQRTFQVSEYLEKAKKGALEHVCCQFATQSILVST